MLSGVPLALDNPSIVFSQYFVGMIPLLMQFISAPLSMSATVFVEKSSTANVTIENHF